MPEAQLDTTGAAAAAAVTVAAPPQQQQQQQQTGVLNLICVKVSWMGKLVETVEAPFHHIRVNPEAEHPKGRKGLVLASAWRQMSSPNDDGMLMLDGDVVIDPVDLNTMIANIATDKSAVWTARTKLWPRSTHYPSWVWSHRKPVPEGMTHPDEIMKYWQTDVEDPQYFTFCFTYLPRFLVEQAIESGLKEWHYPNVDKCMHELAHELGVKVKVVYGDCFPKHVNF